MEHCVHVNFFNKVPFCADVELLERFKPPIEIKAVCGGNRHLILCDAAGRVHLFGPSSELEVKVGRPRKEPVKLGLLYTLQTRAALGGSDPCALSNFYARLIQVTPHPRPPPRTGLYLCSWTDSKLLVQQYNLVPPLNSIYRVVAGTQHHRPSPPLALNFETELILPPHSVITAIAVDHLIIAVGFATGEVYVYQGPLNSLNKFIIVGKEEITGVEVGFSKGVEYVFVATRSGLSCYSCDGGALLLRWKDFSLLTTCMEWSRESELLVVGSEDRLYTVDAIQGNLSALPLSAQILSLCIMPCNRILLVLKDPSSGFVLVIMNADCRLVTYSGWFPHLLEALPCLDHAFVLCSRWIGDAEVEGYWLAELPISDRIVILMKKGLWRQSLHVVEHAPPELKNNLIKVILRLQFMSCLLNGSEATKDSLYLALDCFTSQVRQYPKLVCFTFAINSLLIHASGALGTGAYWRHILKTLLETIILIHNNGVATENHSHLLATIFKEYHALQASHNVLVLLVQQQNLHLAHTLSAAPSEKTLILPMPISVRVLAALKAVNAAALFTAPQANASLRSSWYFCIEDYLSWAQQFFSINPPAVLLLIQNLQPPVAHLLLQQIPFHSLPVDHNEFENRLTELIEKTEDKSVFLSHLLYKAHNLRLRRVLNLKEYRASEELLWKVISSYGPGLLESYANKDDILLPTSNR